MQMLGLEGRQSGALAHVSIGAFRLTKAERFWNSETPLPQLRVVSLVHRVSACAVP